MQKGCDNGKWDWFGNRILLVAQSRRWFHQNIPGDWQIGQVPVVYLRGSTTRKPWYLRSNTGGSYLFSSTGSQSELSGEAVCLPSCSQWFIRSNLSHPFCFCFGWNPIRAYVGIRDSFPSMPFHVSCFLLLCLFLCQVLCWVRVWVVLGWFFLFSWCACVVLCRVVLGHVKSVSPTCAHLAVRCCVRLLRFVSPPCLLDAAALVGSLCPFPVPLREVPDFKPQRRSHGYVIVGVMIGQCGKSTQNRIHPNSQHI